MSSVLIDHGLLRLLVTTIAYQVIDGQENYDNLKGNSGLSTSWAQMKEHEKSKRTSHH